MYLIAPASDKGKNQAWSLSTSMRVSFHFFFPPGFPIYYPLFSFPLLVLSLFPSFFLSSFSGQVVFFFIFSPSKQNHYKRVHLIASVKNQKLVRCNDYLRCDT